MLIVIQMQQGQQQPVPLKYIDGLALIPLVEDKDIEEEGKRQNNALIMPYMRETLYAGGYKLASIRDVNDNIVMSISARNGVCEHVVCKHNAAPSASQLDTLSKLLAEHDTILRYNPFSLY